MNTKQAQYNALMTIDGVYDIDDEAYFANDAINNSSLSTAMISTQLFYHQEILGHSKPSTGAMNLGTIVHDCILRPGRLEKDYIRADPPINESTGNPYGFGSQTYQNWLRQFTERGLTVLSEDDMTHAKTINRTCYRHPIAGTLLSLACATEIAFIQESSTFGLKLKCKADALIVVNPLGDIPGLDEMDKNTLARMMPIGVDFYTYDGIILDVKTSGEYDNFKKSCRKYHYYRADAFYTHLAECVLGGTWLMLFIVVDTSGIERAKVCRVGDDDLHRGRSEMEDALNIIYDCLSKDNPDDPDSWIDERDLRIQTLQLFKGM